MQGREYLFVDCDAYRPHYVNGSELPDWKKVSAAAWANQRGDEWWELVNEAWVRRPALAFKRPKA